MTVEITFTFQNQSHKVMVDEKAYVVDIVQKIRDLIHVSEIVLMLGDKRLDGDEKVDVFWEEVEKSKTDLPILSIHVFT